MYSAPEQDSTSVDPGSGRSTEYKTRAHHAAEILCRRQRVSDTVLQIGLDSNPVLEMRLDPDPVPKCGRIRFQI